MAVLTVPAQRTDDPDQGASQPGRDRVGPAVMLFLLAYLLVFAVTRFLPVPPTGVIRDAVDAACLAGLLVAVCLAAMPRDER